MAIQGIFLADFSQYNAAVDGADAKLRQFTRSTAAHDAAIAAADAKMDRFVITNDRATQVLTRGSGSAQATTTAFGKLGDGLGQVDKTLALFGTHLGPEVRALEELGTVGAQSMSGLALAASGAAAVFAGWKLGNWVADNLPAIDKRVAETTARLLGFGDAAAEVAGAKMDVLARASDIAKRAITDFGEAQKIIQQELKDRLAPILESTQHLLAGWQAEIRKARGDGSLPALTEDIKSHRFSVDQLSRAYGLSTDAIAEYTHTLDQQKEADTNAATEKKRIAAEEADLTKKRVALQKDAADELTAISKKQFGEMSADADFYRGITDKLFHKDDIVKAQNWMAALGDVSIAMKLDSSSQAELVDVLTKGIAVMTQQGHAADDLTQKMDQWRTAMETDSQRVKRESDELAKAMHDNFVIIGQSAEEAGAKSEAAAARTITSWSQAMDLVRHGQGTLGGSFQSIAPGTPGSSIRYDDYGNPYGYIQGVNQPGKISPTGGSSNNIFVDASGSFFDTPADAQRLADKVKYALGTQASSQGGR